MDTVRRRSRSGANGRARQQAAGAYAVLAASLVLLSAGCRSEFVEETVNGRTPHETYAHRLRVAGLAETALGRDWLAAAARSVDESLPVSAPFQEVGFLDPAEARAVGYRVELRRGQQVTASMRFDDDRTVLVFLDLFVLAENSRAPRLLASADSGRSALVFVARRGGEYVLRMQPELLRGGRYTIEIGVTGSLAFPVGGHGMEAIRSVFGDPRDGGRRRHHGVDIFAPRGTPVLAAASGFIRRVSRSRLGGRVIWQRDSLGQSLYYAHLHRQVVRPGMFVEQGDTIGFVGNTGNARTTPPHLHFGVYRRGPADPHPYLEPRPTAPATFVGDVEALGGWARAARARIRVREAASVRGRVLAEVARHTPMRVVGGTGSWYRVYLPDGTTGFVGARVTEPVDQAIRNRTLADGALLRSGPTLAAAPVDSLQAGARVPVLGVYGDFALVQSPGGQAAWLPQD